MDMLHTSTNDINIASANEDAIQAMFDTWFYNIRIAALIRGTTYKKKKHAVKSPKKSRILNQSVGRNSNSVKLLQGLIMLTFVIKCTESFFLEGPSIGNWARHTYTVAGSSLRISTPRNVISNTLPADDAITHDNKTERTLVPLSLNPLLLVSSSPLLSLEESRTLLQYLEMTKDGKSDPLNDVFFEKDGEHVFSTAHKSKVSASTTSSLLDKNELDNIYEKGRKIIYRMRKEIDRLTNSPSHPGDFALPRFLSFNVESIPDPSKDGVRETLHALLPDGLHSDNVNNRLTRHISALLYLSDEVSDQERGGLVGGATTFPLAVPIDKTAADKTKWDLGLEKSAQRLVIENALHTGVRNWDGGEEECTILESAAYSLFQKEIRKNAPTGDVSFKVQLPSSKMGIRVHPKPGKLCVFHNLLDDGTPDPLAFHGGEAILGRNSFPSTDAVGKKVLLVFFKTIPSANASNPNPVELAQKSLESRNWIIDQYY